MEPQQTKEQIMARQKAALERMADFGITQAELARALWLTPGQVNQYLRSKATARWMDKAEAALEELIKERSK